MKRCALICLPLLFVIGLAGCGIYSANSARVDEAVRYVFIPTLENRTAEPSIGMELTDLIIAAIQRDNTLKVVGEDDATADLVGAVTLYRRKEAFTTSQLQVDEYQVQIQVELSFLPRDGSKPLFEKKRLQGTGNYLLDGSDGSDEGSARSLAADEIVRGVLGAIAEDW